MRKTNSIFEMLAKVNDEKTFLIFLNELSNDRKNGNKDEWQNDRIEDFLESAYTWGEDSIEGLKHYEKSENPWKRCAEIIYMGKIYE